MRLFPLIFKQCAWLPFFQRCTLSKSSHSFVTFLLLSVQHPMRDEMRIHWTSRLGNDARGKVFITGKLGDPRWQHKGGGLKILACCNGSSLLTRHTKADWHLYMTPESSIDIFWLLQFSSPFSWPHWTTWKEFSALYISELRNLCDVWWGAWSHKMLNGQQPNALKRSQAAFSCHT